MDTSMSSWKIKFLNSCHQIIFLLNLQNYVLEFYPLHQDKKVQLMFLENVFHYVMR